MNCQTFPIVHGISFQIGLGKRNHEIWGDVPENIVKRCEPCQRILSGPVMFRVSTPDESYFVFEEILSLDLMVIDSKAVLLILDTVAHINAASFFWNIEAYGQVDKRLKICGKLSSWSGVRVYWIFKQSWYRSRTTIYFPRSRNIHAYLVCKGVVLFELRNDAMTFMTSFQRGERFLPKYTPKRYSSSAQQNS